MLKKKTNLYIIHIFYIKIAAFYNVREESSSIIQSSLNVKPN